MDISENTIVVVDDDEDILLSARLFLKRYFKEVHTFQSPEALFEFIPLNKPSLVLLDMNYANGQNDGAEGIKVLERLKTLETSPEVVVMTAYAEVRLAVEAVKKGAFDFVVKPWQNEKLLITLVNALQKKDLNERLLQVEAVNEMSEQEVFPIIGETELIVSQRERIEQFQHLELATYINGDKGVGKRLLARHIHQRSKRSKGAFFELDLSTIKEADHVDLLFGSKGRWLLAEKGTLYISNLFSLSQPAQNKLQSELSKKQTTAPRIITSGNLLHKPTSFSPVLFHALSVIEFVVPPLKERSEDFPDLIDFYLDLYCEQYAKVTPEVVPSMYENIIDYEWPGNVRELQRAIERAIISGKQYLKAEDLLPNEWGSLANARSYATLDSVERKHIQFVLQQNQGNISKAAKDLGISRAALYRRIEKYQVEK
jgi:DNA-binding NtrC family response regulator